MRDGQSGSNHSPCPFRGSWPWFGWPSIGLLVLFTRWWLDLDSTSILGPISPADPSLIILLIGAVAAERYRIVRRHAEGGLGAVYVALDEELQREVALKEILPRHARDTESRNRFVLEAEVTGGLEHPGIVPVYGLGEYPDGRPFYAMRFIRGDSLRKAVAEFHEAEGPERDPVERALAFRRLLTHFVDVCEAIAYSHSRGVLHRDIKPENIMLGKFGETLVVDWGLAKPLGRCFTQDGSPKEDPFASPGVQAEILKYEANQRPNVGDDLGFFDPSVDQAAETLAFESSVPPSIDASAATIDQGPSLAPVVADAANASAMTIDQGPSTSSVDVDIDASAATMDLGPSAASVGTDATDASAMTIDQGPSLLPPGIDASAATMDLGPSGGSSLEASAVTLDQGASGGSSLEASDVTMDLGPSTSPDRPPRAAVPIPPPLDPFAETLEERPLVPSSLGRSSRTLVGSLMGTPAYMSPEQAAGHVDRLGPASDIYSLGGTLYNILTGKPPTTGGRPNKVLAQVIRGEFPRPREVKSSVPPALEAIVLKAMALKPEDRYPTAKALSDDLEHWMADEPVSAYRDPWIARMARWARRHKTAVSTAAALMLAAVVGLTAGSVLLERERERTERERELAVKNYGYAYDAAETMLSHVGDVDLADIPQMEPVRRDLLETARLRLNNLLGQRSGDPEVILLEGRTRARLGSVLEMMGQYADAEKNDREAIESLKALELRDPNDDRPTREMARAHHGLGILLRKLNRFREAEAELREAVRLREQLAAKFPSDRAIRKSLADSRYHLGALLARLASRPEHKDFYAQAIKDQEAELQLDPLRPENRIKLAQYRNNMAILEVVTNPTQAEKEYRKILDLLSSTGLNDAQTSLPGFRWQGARAANNLAKILLTETPPREEASESQLTKARDELSRLNAEFPEIRQYRRELASVFNNLGLLALRRQKPDLAEAAFRQSATLLKDLVASDPQVPDYQQNLSIALFQLERVRARTDLAAAKEGIARVLADQEKLIVNHPEVPDYRNALGRNLLDYGNLLHDRGDTIQALSLAENSAVRFRQALDGDPENRTYTQNLHDAWVLKLLIALTMKRHDLAAQTAERLIEAMPDRRDSYLAAAEALAQCTVLVTGDEKLTSDDRDQRVEVYGRRAVELLREAVNRRLLNGPDPLRVEEFVPLRGRQDFRSLIRELIDRQQPVSA